MISSIEKVSNFVNKIATFISGTILVLLTVLTFIGVIWRYVFNSPITWMYELSIVLFSWLIFIGVSQAFKTNEHIRLDYLETKLSGWAKYILQQLISLICLLFLIIGGKESIAIVQSTWSQTYDTIPVPQGVFYLSFIFCAVFGVINIICNMLTLRVTHPDDTSVREGDKH